MATPSVDQESSADGYLNELPNTLKGGSSKGRRLTCCCTRLEATAGWLALRRGRMDSDSMFLVSCEMSEFLAVATEGGVWCDEIVDEVESLPDLSDLRISAA